MHAQLGAEGMSLKQGCPEKPESCPRVTPRELGDILELSEQGQSDNTIAAELGFSGTKEIHRQFERVEKIVLARKARAPRRRRKA